MAGKVTSIPGGVRGTRRGVPVSVRQLVLVEASDEVCLVIEAAAARVPVVFEVVPQLGRRPWRHHVGVAVPADLAARLWLEAKPLCRRAGRRLRRLRVADQRIELLLADYGFVAEAVDLVARLSLLTHTLEGEIDEAIAAAFGAALVPYRGAPAMDLLVARHQQRRAELAAWMRAQRARATERVAGPTAMAAGAALAGLAALWLAGG